MFAFLNSVFPQTPRDKFKIQNNIPRLKWFLLFKPAKAAQPAEVDARPGRTPSPHASTPSAARILTKVAASARPDAMVHRLLPLDLHEARKSCRGLTRPSESHPLDHPHWPEAKAANTDRECLQRSKRPGLKASIDSMQQLHHFLQANSIRVLPMSKRRQRTMWKLLCGVAEVLQYKSSWVPHP